MPTTQRLRWLPNAVTSFRLLCAVPVFVCAMRGEWALGFWVLLVALASDFFDGMLARKLGVQSHFGAELDARADFLLSAAGIAGLTLSGHLPWSAALVILAASLLMIGVRFYGGKLTGLIAILPMFEVGTLFLGWTYIAWSYATLAFGWSGHFVTATVCLLVVLAVLKRGRLRVWCAAILPAKWRLPPPAK